MTVRDTGIGIPAESLPDHLRHVLPGGPVDRADAPAGSGIGLALVKGLVEMHGGTVTAESDGPGRGSTFTVRLPVAAGRADRRPADGRRSGPAAGRPRRRILVVDDNRDAAESMADDAPAARATRCARAHDGLEAVEAAEAFRPEVILMDVGMPRLNGLDATRRIREQPWGRGMTIIALTGWGQEGDRTRSREAGCDGHLVKPVSLADLQKFLGELAGESGSADRSTFPRGVRVSPALHGRQLRAHRRGAGQRE